jgi:hypothetical protein
MSDYEYYRKAAHKARRDIYASVFGRKKRRQAYRDVIAAWKDSIVSAQKKKEQR